MDEVTHAEKSPFLARSRRRPPERWRFYADGPLRLAPAVWQGKVYFGANDACFYCLDADTGTLLWKFQAALANRLILSNDRLISVWPVRGGSVIADGRLYFTAGVWPFEDTQLYSVDLAGESEPTRIPPHTTTSLPDFSPQGYLAASKGRLFIPGGHAKAIGIDLRTGARVGLTYDPGTATATSPRLDRGCSTAGRLWTWIRGGACN